MHTIESTESKIKILKILIKVYCNDPEKKIQLFNWAYILESIHYEIEENDVKIDILKFLIKKNYSNPNFKYEFANWTDILEVMIENKI
jgi:hypothetical protein